MLHLSVIHAAAPGQTGDLLLGIAGIITACGAIGVPVYLARRRRGHATDDDSPAPDLYADARRSIELLRGTVKDLERQLRACRAERDRLDGEAEENRRLDQQKDMHIGVLEGQLAETRRQLRDLEALVRDQQ